MHIHYIQQVLVFVGAHTKRLFSSSLKIPTFCENGKLKYECKFRHLNTTQTPHLMGVIIETRFLETSNSNI